MDTNWSSVQNERRARVTVVQHIDEQRLKFSMVSGSPSDFRADTHGLKAFRRKALLDIVTACVVDRDMFSEFVVRAHRAGKWLEVPIDLVDVRPPSICFVVCRT